jgi:hypothetical protein
MLPEYYNAIYAQTLKEVPRIEGLSVFDQLISERITFYVKTETDRALVNKYVKSLLATAKQYFVELSIDIIIRDEGSSTEEIIKQSMLDSQIQAQEEVDRAKQERLLATGPIEGKFILIPDIPVVADELKEF